MSSIGTIGGVHHVAWVVRDAEAAASFHEQALGWVRLTDRRFSGAEASAFGSVLGLAEATEFHTIMLRNPDGRTGAQVELIDLDTPTGPGHLVAAGLHVESYRVADIEAAWSQLLTLGAEVVQPPVELRVDSWSLRAATARAVGGSLLEIVQYAAG